MEAMDPAFEKRSKARTQPRAVDLGKLDIPPGRTPAPVSAEAYGGTVTMKRSCEWILS